jgi:hypothetical protein
MGGGPDISQSTATIANGAATSNAIQAGQMVPVALVMPAAFTGATVSFTGTFDGTNYFPIWSAGALYTETVSTSVIVVLTPLMLAGLLCFKIVSASNEGGARTITVLSRRGE